MNAPAISALEHYATPPDCIDAMVRQTAIPLSGLVLDAGCGSGAIAGRLIERWGVQPFRVQGVEIHEGRAQEARDRWGIHVDVGDFLQAPIDVSNGGFALVVENPPFSLAMEFLLRSLALTAPQRGTVAALLRLSWLASKERAAFLKAQRPDVHVLSSRPSFAATVTCGQKQKKIAGCGWRISIPTDAPRPKQCEACGQPVSVNTQDASEYAWFLFGPGRRGRWYLLDEEPAEPAVQVEEVKPAQVEEVASCTNA